MTITEAKETCAERLRSWSYFSDIPIFLDEETDLRGTIDRYNTDTLADGGKIGIFVVIAVSGCREIAPGALAPSFQYQLVVQVHEDPETNRADTGVNKMAEEVCEQALLILRQFDADDFRLAPDDQAGAAIRSPFAPYGFQGMLRLHKTDDTAYRQVGHITAVVAGGNCTLTCATDGAVIYYTTDGTYPRAGNDTAVLYSAPFAVASATVIRAVGYKTETGYTWISSDLTKATA